MNSGQRKSVAVRGCVGRGSTDALIYELAEPVTELPVTPVLYGCEVDRYLYKNQDVVIAGFGRTRYNGGTSGIKYWVEDKITDVANSYVLIGRWGDGKSACNGDSGGPTFVQVGDGS